MAEGVLALLALEEWRSEHTHSYDNGEFGRLSMSVCMLMSLKDVILHSLSLSLIDPFSPFRSTTGGRLNVDLQRKVPLNFNGSSKRGFFNRQPAHLCSLCVLPYLTQVTMG